MTKKVKHLPQELEQAFKKAGLRLKKCTANPLDPEQKRQIDAADEAVRTYLMKLDKAYKLSRKSSSSVLYANKAHTR